MVGDEPAGALALAGAPIRLGGQARVTDGVAESFVEAFIDRCQQTAFGAEVVIKRTRAQPGAAGQRAEFHHAVAADQLGAGGVEKVLTPGRGACHSGKHNRTQLCFRSRGVPHEYRSVVIPGNGR